MSGSVLSKGKGKNKNKIKDNKTIQSVDAPTEVLPSQVSLMRPNSNNQLRSKSPLKSNHNGQEGEAMAEKQLDIVNQNFTSRDKSHMNLINISANQVVEYQLPQHDEQVA